MSLSLNNIPAVYSSIQSRFRQVQNWEEAKAPLKAIAGEINLINKELLQYLDKAVFIPRAGGLIRSLENSHRRQTQDFPQPLKDMNISWIQVIESKARPIETIQPGSEPGSEFIVKIQSAIDQSLLTYSFRADQFTDDIKLDNLLHLDAQEGEGRANCIHYSSVSNTQDWNDPKLATPDEVTYQAPYISFITNQAARIPEHAPSANQQGFAPVTESRIYWRSLSEAQGWNKVISA